MSQRPGRKTSCARCRAGVLRITPFHCLFKVCAASIQRFSSSHGGELQVQKLRIEILPHTRHIQHLHILLGFQVRGAAVPSSNSDLLRRQTSAQGQRPASSWARATRPPNLLLVDLPNQRYDLFLPALPQTACPAPQRFSGINSGAARSMWKCLASSLSQHCGSASTHVPDPVA